MDALRGMKILYIGEDEKAHTANIKVMYKPNKIHNNQPKFPIKTFS
jgi:hypothetical protein